MTPSISSKRSKSDYFSIKKTFYLPQHSAHKIANKFSKDEECIEQTLETEVHTKGTRKKNCR